MSVKETVRKAFSKRVLLIALCIWCTYRVIHWTSVDHSTHPDWKFGLIWNSLFLLVAIDRLSVTED